MTVIIPVEMHYEGNPDDTYDIELTAGEILGLSQVLGAAIMVGLVDSEREDDVTDIVHRMVSAVMGEEAVEKARKEARDEFRRDAMSNGPWVDPSA